MIKLKSICRALPLIALLFMMNSCGNAGDNNALPILVPRVSIDDMMAGAIEPASNGLWAVAMEENAPRSERDWQALENYAIQLIGAASAITLGGSGTGDMPRVKDPRWLQYSADLARISNNVLAAARDRDLDAVLEAGNGLIEPCSNCHADFPPSNPAEP